MRSRIDNILLGLLWLLAATLATTFWFNIRFGFNIFAAQHWQYLAYLQASKSPVTTTFYISLGIAVFIAIFGLYILVQPNKFTLPRIRMCKNPSTPPITTQQKIAPPAQGNTAFVTASNSGTPTPTQTNIPPQPQMTAETQNASPGIPATQSAPRTIMQRPPRLAATPGNLYAAAPAPAPAPKKSSTDENDATLRKIFEENGYIVKNNPFINGFRPNLVAIGTNEVIYIGAIGATTTQVRTAIDRLNQVFTDTLEDVYIDINGFAINAPDAATSEFEDILMFNTPDELATYMAEHPNPQPTADERDNFDAYSEYIDTVIGYIGKL